MDIKDFILTNNNNEMKEETEQKKKPARSNVKYEIAIENGSDFVINRITSRAETSLVVIVSQTPFQAYIKKGDEIEALTSENYVKFMASYQEEELELNNTFWIKDLKKSKKFGVAMLNYLNNYARAIKAGVGFFDPDIRPHYEGIIERFYFQHPKLAVAIRDAIVDYYGDNLKSLNTNATDHFSDLQALALIEAQYGLDLTRKYINEVVSRGLQMTSEYYIQNLYESVFADIPEEMTGRNAYGRDRRADWSEYFKKNTNRLEFSKWLEYSLNYEREGYRTMNTMMSDWADDLRMQKMIYGKIKEKYPSNLCSHHNRLAVKANILKREFDRNALGQVGDKYKDLEDKFDGYTFHIPETPEEIVEEAVQQNNCLRSYISRMAEQKCVIAFLRKAKKPDESWVTIELTPAMEIVQIKGKNNREASGDAMIAIRKWADRNNLHMGRNNLER